MATTTDRLRKRARRVTKDLHKMADIARNGARKNIRQLRVNASERYGQGRDKMHKVARGMVRFVRHRPLGFALIAGGVGLVLGGFGIRRLRIALGRKKNAR